MTLNSRYYTNNSHHISPIISPLDVLAETAHLRPNHTALIFKSLHVSISQLGAFSTDFTAVDGGKLTLLSPVLK